MALTISIQAVCFGGMLIIGLIAAGKIQRHKRRREELKRAQVLLKALQLEQSYEHWAEHHV